MDRLYPLLLPSMIITSTLKLNQLQTISTCHLHQLKDHFPYPPLPLIHGLLPPFLYVIMAMVMPSWVRSVFKDCSNSPRSPPTTFLSKYSVTLILKQSSQRKWLL